MGKYIPMITLTVPELPDLRLVKNRRRGRPHQETARLIREENERWYYLLLPWVQLSRRAWPMARARLSWELTFPSRRIPDDDGTLMALAPIRDLLCCGRREAPEMFSLGLLLHDSPAHLVSTPLVQRYEKGVSQTKIMLEEI